MQILIDTNGHSDLLMSQEKQAQLEFEQDLTYEEAFWKDKSRITRPLKEIETLLTFTNLQKSTTQLKAFPL